MDTAQTKKEQTMTTKLLNTKVLIDTALNFLGTQCRICGQPVSLDDLDLDKSNALFVFHFTDLFDPEMPSCIAHSACVDNAYRLFIKYNLMQER